MSLIIGVRGSMSNHERESIYSTSSQTADGVFDHDNLRGCLSSHSVDWISNLRPPGYELQSYFLHSSSPGYLFRGSLAIFGSQEPDVSRRSDQVPSSTRIIPFLHEPASASVNVGVG
jgi:hypothetical protein